MSEMRTVVVIGRTNTVSNIKISLIKEKEMLLNNGFKLRR